MRQKNIYREGGRERKGAKRKETMHIGTLKRRSVFCINPERDAR